MADIYGSTSTTGAPGASPSAQHESHHTAERRDWLQEAGQEVSQKVQEMTRQGQELPPSCMSRGVNSCSPGNSSSNTKCGRNLSSHF